MTAPRTYALSLSLAALAAVAGCDGDNEYDFPVEVEVRSEAGGVPGAVLTMGGAELGRTGPDGRFVGTFHGIAGQEAVLDVAPPADYKLGPEGGQFKVALGTTETEEGTAPQTLAFQVKFEPTTLEFVVLVTSAGKFRPVWVGEEQVARTSSRGAAVVLVRGKAGDVIEVKVEPREKEPLLGKSFTLADGERLLQLADEDVVSETAEQVQEREERAAKAPEAPEDVAVLEKEMAAVEAEDGGSTAALDIATGGGAPVEATQEDKAAAKAAAKDAAAAAKAAKAAAKQAAASAKKVAKTMAKFPGAQEAIDAEGAAKAASDAAGTAGDAAKAAEAAAKAKDRYGAQDALRDAQENQRRAEEEAARAAQLVDEAKRRLDMEKESLTAEADAAKGRLAGDREQWVADAQAAADAAGAAAAEAKQVAADAKKLAAGAKAAKKDAAKGAKDAAAAAKNAAAAAKKAKALPAKAKKAGVGEGEAVVTAAQDAQNEADAALTEARTALSAVRRAAEADAAGGAAAMAAANPDAGEDADPLAMADAALGGGKGGKGGADGKGGKGDKGAKEAGGETPGGGAECTLDAVKQAHEGGDIAAPLLAACAKLSASEVDRPEICLTIAKHFFAKKNWKKQAKALECASEAGQYKYDPMVLMNLIKVYLNLGNFRDAESMFDRFMQVKDRMPGDMRKDRVCEMYRLMAQTKEQIFYKEQEADPEADNLPLLEQAIDFWQRRQGYCGADPDSKKAIAELKKMKDELGQ